MFEEKLVAAKTLYDKLWESHVVHTEADGAVLLYIDRQLLHEVTSPQAFSGLRAAGRKAWRIDANIATADHNVPTTDRAAGIVDPTSRLQVDTLDQNCAEFGIEEFGMLDPRQGIVHVIAPEQGLTLPGMTVVCGDSHTATHGALGALAFGIGTTEVEHVLATQCLWARKSKSMRVWVDGELGRGVTAKDMVLAIIGKMGTAGGTGYAIEFAGPAVQALSVEGRMTLIRLHAADIAPQVTWGTSPEMVAEINATIPDPAQESDMVRRKGWTDALAYMDLQANTPLSAIALDKVFIGSCTNARIEDLRAAAAVAKGHQKAASVKVAMVVPGSGLVKAQAEAEGLDRIFKAAGFEWREPGCSMCLAMNADRLEPGERCASTSNRNFEGRQGAGGRTHLVSPAMAAAAAIAGHFVDVRDWSAP